MLHERLCSQCGGDTIIVPEGERVCASCGCAESILVSGFDSPGTHEAVDPHSFDDGLGSEPLQTIRELKFGSRMLMNSWQTVLGYYKIGKIDAFVESCLNDVEVALDRATDEQYLQCR